MPIVPFENCIGTALKPTLLLADSSFVLSLLGSHPYPEASKAFFNANRLNVKFCINVVIKQEILKATRTVLLLDQARQMLTGDQFSAMMKMDHRAFKGDYGKYLIEKGRRDIVESGLRGKISKAFEIYKNTFSYVRGPASPLLEWEQAMKLMEEFGLNSSDALILNFACNVNDFTGLATTDSDFYLAGHSLRTKIYMPNGLIQKAQGIVMRQKNRSAGNA